MLRFGIRVFVCHLNRFGDAEGRQEGRDGEVHWRLVLMTVGVPVGSVGVFDRLYKLALMSITKLKQRNINDARLAN